MAELGMEERLARIESLLEELADDNASVIGTLNRLNEATASQRASMMSEMDRLREDVVSNLSYRALKDICRELMPVLSAAERFVSEHEGSGDEVWRMHVAGIGAALRHTLERFGVEKIAVEEGVEQFQMERHACVKLVAAGESPFPDAAPRTVVKVLEDGYMIGGKVVQPARVEVQAPPAQQVEAARTEEEGNGLS